MTSWVPVCQLLPCEVAALSFLRSEVPEVSSFAMERWCALKSAVLVQGSGGGARAERQVTLGPLDLLNYHLCHGGQECMFFEPQFPFREK